MTFLEARSLPDALRTTKPTEQRGEINCYQAIQSENRVGQWKKK